METSSEVLKRDKLILAANYEPSYIYDIEDTAYCAFRQVMLYRREIAIELLKKDNEFKVKELEEIYEYCNKKIKDVLGL